MHVAFAGVLTWLCLQDIKSLNHLFIFNYTDHICRLIASFSASLLYQPAKILPLLTALRKHDLMAEVVYLTKRELLLNHLQ